MEPTEPKNPESAGAALPHTGEEISNTASEFDWIHFLTSLVHPLKVWIVEAHLRTGLPLSPTDLSEVFDKQIDLSSISYHVTTLAKAGVLTKVRTRRVRGSVETFYRLQ